MKTSEQKQERSTELASELLRQIALVTVIPLIIIFLFVAGELLPQLKQNLISKQQSIAGLVARQTIDQITNAEQDVNTLFTVAKQFPRRRLQDVFTAFIQDNSIFESIYLIDDNGTITDIAVRDVSENNSNALYKNLDISKSVIYKTDEMQKNSGWSQVFLSVVTGRLSTAYYRPVKGGTLIAELDIDRLPKLSRKLGKLGILVMVLDQNDQLIAHPDRQLSQMQISMRDLSLVTEYDRKMHSQAFTWNNSDYFGTQAPIQGLGWSVIVAEDATIMTKAIYNRLSLWFLAMFGLLFCAMVFAYLRVRRFSARFRKLSTYASNIAHGQYNTEPGGLEITEFKLLADDLVAMSEAIQKRESSLQSKEHQLRKLNAGLEERVTERTKELQATNDELSSTISILNNTMGQLVQSEKLASLGSLVAGIAHELNTPIGNANIASSTLGDFAKEMHEQLLEGSIKKSRLEEFLNDAHVATGITTRNLERAAELITSFKQVAADQSSAQRRRFRLKNVAHEILITLYPQTKKRSIDIHNNIPENIQLESYPGPLGQVLSNLIMNALIHGFKPEEEGQVELDASIDALGNNVVIQVRDTGQGISEKQLARVFDPFFTTKLGQGGSGLGLHICHNITTEVLGGDITVASSDGGTWFTLTIPLMAPTSPRIKA